MRKIFVSILFISFFLNLFGQKNIIDELYHKDEINWDNIIIYLPDTVKKRIVENNEHLKFYTKYSYISYQNFKFTDFNNDQKLDAILYYTIPGLARGLCLFINNGSEYEQIFHEGGKLLKVERETPISPIYIQITTVTNTDFPYTDKYTELCFIPIDGEFKFFKKSVLNYDKVVLPEKKKFFIPFIVENEKYRLRASPEIIDGKMDHPYNLGNVIAEFTTGDKGYALTDSVDNTGRVWWFVMMENNIDKDIKEFLHIDKNQEEQTKMSTFGWISSRYVKVIYQ